MSLTKVELNTAALNAAMMGVAAAFREAWMPPGDRRWPSGFQLLSRRRRCQLCAMAYTEDPPLPGCGYSDHPPMCADCEQIIDRVAENLSGKLGMKIPTEAVVGLIGHRITYGPFQPGRSWQDHVPAHSRQLIKETP